MSTTPTHPSTCWCGGSGWRRELNAPCNLPQPELDELERTEQQVLLEAASPEALLQTFAALTHRMGNGPARSAAIEQGRADLRAQRDLVKAELLRRLEAVR